MQHIASTALFLYGGSLKHWTESAFACMLLRNLGLSIAQMHELNEIAYVSLKCMVVSLTIMSLTCASAGADTEVTTRSMHQNYALNILHSVL